MLFLLLISWALQSDVLADQTAQSATPKPQGEAQAELQKRMEAAIRARSSGDPNRIKIASQSLIALALREMAQLRLIESAYSQSAELYRRSLDFEDDTGTHVDLAIAEVGRFNPDAALTQLGPVLDRHPDDLRALTAAGRAWTLKKDYGKAAEYLGRVATISPTIDSLYSWATCLLASKDQVQRAQGARVFEQMTKTAGESGSLHVMFGRAYRDAGEILSAVAEFQKAIAIDPHTPHAHYFLGLARLSMNEWAPTPEVRSEFLSELREYPRDYLANYMLGYVDSVEHHYDESNRRLQLAAEIDATTPEPWLYLGLNSYALGDNQSAESSLRKAILLTRDDESRAAYQVRRAYITLGRILMASGRAEEGKKFLDKGRELQNKVLELSQLQIGAHLLEGGAGAAAVVQPLAEKSPVLPDSGPVDLFAKLDQTALGQSSLSEAQKQDAERQEQSLRSVLGFGFAELGTSEAMVKVYRSALTHFQEAEGWDSHVPALYRNLGVAAYRANDLPEAVRALKLAIAENPADSPIRAILGLAYFASDQYPDAVSVLSPLGQPGMRDPLAGYAWAASLAKLGDFKQATVVLTELDRNELPPDTLLLVAQLWLTIEDYSQAIVAIERALKVRPDLPRAHYFAGVAYTQWQKQGEAIREFQAQLALTPDDPETKNNLGYVLLEQGKSQEAESLFRDVLQNHPENGMAQYQLGKILLERNDVAGAVAHLETAAHSLPEADYVHYQLQAAYRKASRNEDADRELQRYKELKARNRQASIPRPAPPTP